MQARKNQGVAGSLALPQYEFIVAKLFALVHFESRAFMKILLKVKIQDLENSSHLGKHSNHFKNIKTSLKNDPLHKSSMSNNNIEL